MKSTKLMLPRRLVTFALAALVAVTAGSRLSAQEEVPKLPEGIYEIFLEMGYKPTAVVIVQEGELEHEVFQVPGFPLEKGNIDVSTLKLPELTIQDVGSKVICTKYTCFTTD